ncbi:MAG: hypothetical protein LBC77_05865 [Spirochaetaceae bacterium]|nr:hypothetical protein [Spirochaetaceae bacterium]
MGGGGRKRLTPPLVIAALLCAFVISSCEDGSTDTGGGGGRPAKSDFYGTWNGVGAASGWTSTTTETSITTTAPGATGTYTINSWEELTNTNTDTKAEYPYGYKIYVSYIVGDDTFTSFMINYMNTSKNKIGAALTTNPGYDSMTYYTK